MKSNFLILVFIFSSLTGCLSQVNDTDPQVSKNIKESKQNGFYIKSYMIASSTDNNIILKEAWVEKGWKYTIYNNKIIKEVKEWCNLCFTLKQTPNLIYSFKNIDKWQIKNEITKNYVGRRYSVKNGIYDGIYELGFNNCEVPDTISLDLIDYNDTGHGVIKTKVGTLVFKAIDSMKINPVNKP